MIGVRAGLTLTVVGETTVVLRSNPWRRGLFAAITLLLVFSMVVGIRSGEPLSRSSLPGLLFYGLIVCASGFVAAYEKRFVMRTTEQDLALVVRVFGIAVHVANHSLSGLSAVLLNQLRPDAASEMRSDIELPGRFAAFARRRPGLAKLALEVDDRRLPIDEGTDTATVEALGRQLAIFLGVPMRCESI